MAIPRDEFARMAEQVARRGGFTAASPYEPNDPHQKLLRLLRGAPQGLVDEAMQCMTLAAQAAFESGQRSVRAVPPVAPKSFSTGAKGKSQKLLLLVEALCN